MKSWFELGLILSMRSHNFQVLRRPIPEWRGWNLMGWHVFFTFGLLSLLAMALRKISPRVQERPCPFWETSATRWIGGCVHTLCSPEDHDAVCEYWCELGHNHAFTTPSYFCMYIFKYVIFYNMFIRKCCLTEHVSRYGN